MKRIFTIFLTLFVASSVWAETFEVNNIRYSVTNSTNKTVAVIKSKSEDGYSGNMTIPSSVTYNGITYTITSINESVFTNCIKLTSITIPNTVTSLGSTFEGCTNLSSVTIPESITKIDDNAFNGCTSLTLVAIPNNVSSIGDYAFNDCTSLASVIMTNSVTSIGNYAFSGCTNLTSIIISNSVTSIGVGAFKDCTSLISVTIPERVTAINGSTFKGCTSLTLVAIPNSVSSIGSNAFSGCTSLTSITIPENISSSSDISTNAFEGCTSITSLIWNAISYTDEGEFDATDEQWLKWNAIGKIVHQITNLVIGENVKKFLDVYHFLNNVTNLKSITLNAPNCEFREDFPQNFYSIAYQFTDLIIGERVSVIPYGLIGNSYFTSITMPKTMYVNSLYLQKDGIRYRVINGECVVAIGATDTYKDVVIPNSITAGNTFFVKSIEYYGNNWQSLTSITIQNGVESIGDNAFGGCTNLTSIAIPSSITSIGEHAFRNCSGLTSIILPEGVITIGNNAFTGCTGITSMVIPNSVISIGDYAFSSSDQGSSSCIKLKEVSIGSACTIGSNAFAGCSRLIDITCYSEEVPLAVASSFANYNGYLYVPCEYTRYYKADNVFGQFANIECIASNEAELERDEVYVVPEISDALFSMPKNTAADTYTLTIQKNGVTFCSLTFNSQGQLANIDFSTKAGAVQGFQFTVTGLSTATTYGYSFKALASNKSVLKEYSGSFTTKNEDGTGGSVQGGGEGSGQGSQGGEGGEGGSTAISEVSNTTAVTVVNGQILVNGEAPAFVVTVSGQKIPNANLKSGVYFVVVDGNTVGVSVR